MAGKIIADIIEAPAGRISLNVGNTVVASINAAGIFTSTGNLVITQANSIGTAAIENGAVTNAKLSLSANDSNIKTALNASGSPGIFAARAWVNFNGSGTVAIRGSGNVSSITDNGTGDYTVNFTTAMPDANYAATAMTSRDPFSTGTGDTIAVLDGSLFATGSLRVFASVSDTITNSQTVDRAHVLVIVMR